MSDERRILALLADCQSEIDALHRALGELRERAKQDMGALALVADAIARAPAFNAWRGQLVADLRAMARVAQVAPFTAGALELAAEQIEKIDG